jgi:O-antigen/teichoic acid export membrane protein
MMSKRIDKKLGNQVARGSLIGSIALGVGYLTQYLFHMSVSRTLDAETAGKLFISFAFVLLVATVTRLGLDNTGLKVVSVNFSDGRLGNIRRIALLISLLVSLVSILVMILLFFSSSILTALISLPDDKTSISIIYLSIPVIALSYIFSEVLRGMRLIGLSGIIQLVAPYGIAILVIWSAYYLSANVPLAGALAFFAGYACSALLGIIFILKATTASGTSLFSHYSVVAKGAPYALWSSLIIFAMSSGDIIILGYFVPSDNVAYYFAAARTASLISVGMVGINSIIAPMIASAYRENNINHLAQVVRIGARLSLSVAVFLIGFLFISGEWVLSFFGKGYEDSFVLLLILLLGQLVNSAVGAVLYIMLMSNQEKRSARILAVVIVTMLALYLIIIPMYGIKGAAIVTALGVVAWNLGMMRSIYKTLGVITYADNISRCILYLTGVAVIAFIVDVTATHALYPAILYIVVTPLVLWKYVLHDEDRDALMSIIK